jgi:hypothetical protein
MGPVGRFFLRISKPRVRVTSLPTNGSNASRSFSVASAIDFDSDLREDVVIVRFFFPALLGGMPGIFYAAIATR